MKIVLVVLGEGFFTKSFFSGVLTFSSVFNDYADYSTTVSILNASPPMIIAETMLAIDIVIAAFLPKSLAKIAKTDKHGM